MPKARDRGSDVDDENKLCAGWRGKRERESEREREGGREGGRERARARAREREPAEAERA